MDFRGWIWPYLPNAELDQIFMAEKGTNGYLLEREKFGMLHKGSESYGNGKIYAHEEDLIFLAHKGEG